eukprot:TRINITY_DN1513_c0_g1_i1.p1 TRINITY_DN1513_c0_g1~~TRINITY_DN1513_c0_g1_i1.p1  ORF type:complete len:1212 (-),score=333.05 TRINITY_DN1513_c0_g1_i1:71-3706(-)
MRLLQNDLGPLIVAILGFVLLADALIITNPSSLRGVYPSQLSNWGPIPPLNGTSDLLVNKQVVYANPPTACTNLIGNYTGMIIFIDRGGCAFDGKVARAQSAGAIAAIIGDVFTGKDFYAAGTTTVNIPSVVVRTSVAVKIRAALNGTSVFATFTSERMKPDQLVAIHKFFNNTGGRASTPTWGNLTNAGWDPCQETIAGLACDMFGNLVQLEETTSQGFYGTFDASIFRTWTEMRIILLSTSSQYTGQIEDDLFDYLPVINEFTITGSTLYGPLPSSLVNATTLVSLILKNARFNGTIPELGTPGLVELDLSGNAFTGSLPEFFANHPTLESALFSNNKLNGSVPPISAPNLQVLDISINQLSGEIIIQSELTSLLVGNNSFSGKVPEIATLTSVDFSNNKFTSLGDLALPGVLRLDLSGNPFPRIPLPNYSGWTSLSFFSAAGTNLTGPLISQQFPATLTQIDLSNMPFLNSTLNNMVDATAPASLAGALNSIVIVNSGLSGSSVIFDTLATTSASIQTLNLAKNQITGDVNLFSLTSLIRIVDLSNNALDGTIRDTLSSAPLAYFNVSGNPKLKALSNNPLPSWLDLDYSVLSIDDKNHWECPGVKGVLRTMSADIDQTYNNYYGCLCSPEYFRSNNTFLCENCPSNGVCPGHENQSLVVTPRGFYPFPSPVQPQVIAKCRNASLTNNPCNPDNLDNFVCQDGYTDRFCSDCQEGYFHLDRQCMPCGSETEYVSFFFMLVILVIFVVYVMIVQQTQWRRGTFSILVFYLQISGRLLSSGVFPSLSKSSLLNLVFATSTFHLVAFECFKHGAFDYEARFYVISLAPFMILAGLLLIYGLSRLLIFLFRNKIAASTKLQNKVLLGVDCTDAKDPADKVELIIKIWLFRVFIYAYKLLHFPICSKVFSVFNCIPDPLTQEPYLNDALWLPCNDPKMVKIQATAIIVIIVYVAGSMIVFFGLLFKFRPRGKKGQSHVALSDPGSPAQFNLKDKEDVEREMEEVDPTFDVAETNAKYQTWITRELGVIYLCYKPGLYWAEIYFMTRRLALALVLSLIEDESAASAAVSLIVLLLALIIHAWMKPYNVSVDNNLELTSLSVIVVSYLLSILIGNIGFGTSNEGIQYLIFIGNLILLLFLVCVVLYNSRNWFSNTFGFRQIPALKAPNVGRLFDKVWNAMERKFDGTGRTQVYSNRNTNPPIEDVELADVEKKSP